MDTQAEALLAVTLVVALGWALRRTGLLPGPAWAPIERVTYFVLFPALLFLEIARADLGAGSAGRLALALVGAQLALFAAAAALRRPLDLDGPAYTTLVQGVVRWNSYVALALSPLLFGREGLGLAAVAIGALTPMANLLSVVVLARHGRGPQARPSLRRGLLTNPILLACLLALVWNLAGVPLPRLVVEPLTILGRATLALGLLSVGAALQPIRQAVGLKVVALAAVGRLLVEPLLAIGLARSLGLSGTRLGVVALCAAVPSSSAAYVLARLMGGDAPLMAAIVTVTSIAALLTLPLMLALAG